MAVAAALKQATIFSFSVFSSVSVGALILTSREALSGIMLVRTPPSFTIPIENSQRIKQILLCLFNNWIVNTVLVKIRKKILYVLRFCYERTCTLGSLDCSMSSNGK